MFSFPTIYVEYDVPQENGECDFVKLLFTYNPLENKSVQLLQEALQKTDKYNFSVGSMSIIPPEEDSLPQVTETKDKNISNHP